MTQEIIAIAIVIFTTLYAIYKIYKSLTTKEKSACGGCSCGSKKDIFKQINTAKKSALTVKHLKHDIAFQKPIFAHKVAK